MANEVYLDTNVWIDYFEGTRLRNHATVELITMCLKKGYRLVSASTTIPDLHYNIQADDKRELAKAGQVVSEKDALLAKEYANACIDTLSNMASVIPVGYNDIRMAFSLNKKHPDFEDNIIAATALRVSPLVFVTNDKNLLKHTSLPAMTTEDALAYLKAREAA